MTQISPLTASNVYSELMKKENVAALATAPDSALAQISALKTREESGFDKYQARSKAIAGSIIPSYLVARGVMETGSLGNRLKGVTKSAASLGTAMGAMSLFLAADNFVTKKSKKVQEFKANHPTVSGLGTVAGLVGSMMIGDKAYAIALREGTGIRAAANKLFAKVDASRFATKILPKAKEAVKDVIAKAPKAIQNAMPAIKTAGKTVLKAAPWLLVGAYIIDSVAQAKKENKLFDKNMTELANAKVAAIDTVTEAFKI